MRSGSTGSSGTGQATPEKFSGHYDSAHFEVQGTSPTLGMLDLLISTQGNVTGSATPAAGRSTSLAR